MKFSIVTPSLNQLPYLRRCIASVADQAGVEAEHWVVDGGSTDGTVKYLQAQASARPAGGRYVLRFLSEPDNGMYDALNKGFARASGDMFAWLNCDEQYLPGALSHVQRWMQDHAQGDLLHGGVLLIRPDGTLLAGRRAVPLRLSFVRAAHLYNLSCGLFFRRDVWERSSGFDTSFRCLGDQEWMERLLNGGVRTGCTGRFLGAFCFTGSNLSRRDQARAEERRLAESRGRSAAVLRPVLNGLRRMEKALHGAYRNRFLSYEVYQNGMDAGRTRFHAASVSFRWPEDGRR